MVKKEFIKKSLIKICLSTNQPKVNPNKNTPIFYVQRKKAIEYFGISPKLANREINTFNKLYDLIINNNQNPSYS
jgi:hypothetical protein